MIGPRAEENGKPDPRRPCLEIEYLEDLNYDNGTFSIRFPMTLTPRYIPGSLLPDRKGSGWSPDTSQVDDASLITPPHVMASRDHRITLRASIDAGIPLEIVASTVQSHVRCDGQSLPARDSLQLSLPAGRR